MVCISKLGRNVQCYFSTLMPPVSLCEQAFVHANCGGVTVNDGAFLFEPPFPFCAVSQPEFDPYCSRSLSHTQPFPKQFYVSLHRDRKVK